MGSQLWLLTDRQILEDYPQARISEALKLRCREQEVGFALVLMDHIALTVTDGHLGLQINQKIVTAYPQVILVRLPTPTVQSDSAITVLRHLEKLGCRLVNHPKAILNCVNKFWTFQELAGHGIPLPDTFSYGLKLTPGLDNNILCEGHLTKCPMSNNDFHKPGHRCPGGHDDFSKMIQAAEPLGYPVVVKNTRGYQGRAVFLARDKHHLLDLSHLMRHDAPYLFQKYVKESHGKGVRVVIVGGRLIGSILCCSTDDRMQSNCCLGGTGVSCALSEQGKLLASRVSSILDVDVCAIDLLLQDNGSFVVCDADANVSFTEFDQACKLDLGGVIADYALSLLPGKIPQETPPLSAAPGAEETQETKGQEPSASCSRIEDIKDSPNVPRPPAPSDCTHNTDK